jgi:hypothetical protein
LKREGEIWIRCEEVVHNAELGGHIEDTVAVFLANPSSQSGATEASREFPEASGGSTGVRDHNPANSELANSG